MAEPDFHFPLVRRNSSGKLIPTIMVTPISSSPTTDQEHKVDYYASGNKELSTETALTVKRLEPVSTRGCGSLLTMVVPSVLPSPV